VAAAETKVQRAKDHLEAAEDALDQAQADEARVQQRAEGVN
jgi:hypothetical protein